jgi:hypothetical protein
MVRQVLVWPLVATGRPRVDAVASSLLLAALALSRLLLLADGPWEQDEALIAAGVVDFDPVHHLPLPPGFPLWIWIGRLVRWLGVGDPLVALQVASAVLSVLGIWALVGLWDGIAGRTVALAGAGLAAFLPGVWFHAVRGFSETPAASLAVLGFAFWLRCGAKGFVPGVLAMTAAALIRPPLVPFFVLAVLLASMRMHRRLGSLALAAGLASALVLLVSLPLVGEAGGWGLMWSVSRAHAESHMEGLGAGAWSLEDAGFVRGLGTSLAAGVFAGLAAIGWWSWRKRLLWRWWAGLLAGGWLLYLLVFVHNYTYPRYWVLAWLLLATPVVAGLGVVLRVRWLAVGAATGAAAVAAMWVWPAMSWQHGHALPAVSAFRMVAAEGTGVVVFEDQFFSFRGLARVTGALQVASLRLSEIPKRTFNLAGRPIWFLTETTALDISSPVSRVTELACPEPRLRRLSQERFLSARLVRNPILAWQGVSVPEWDGGERFMWCEKEAVLLLPPLDGAGTLVAGVDVHPSLDGLPLEAWVMGEKVFDSRLEAGPRVIRIPVPRISWRNRLSKVMPVRLRASRFAKVHGDLRELSLRIYRANVEAPPFEAAPLVFFPEAASLQAALVVGEGYYPAELMGMPPQPAAWLGPRASFHFTASKGLVGVELIAPRPTPAQVEVRIGNALARVTVTEEPVEVAVSVGDDPPWAHEVTLEITSTPFRPGGGDDRVLGVAVTRVWFSPEG